MFFPHPLLKHRISNILTLCCFYSESATKSVITTKWGKVKSSLLPHPRVTEGNVFSCACHSVHSVNRYDGQGSKDGIGPCLHPLHPVLQERLGRKYKSTLLVPILSYDVGKRRLTLDRKVFLCEMQSIGSCDAKHCLILRYNISSYVILIMLLFAMINCAELVFLIYFSKKIQYED